MPAAETTRCHLLSGRRPKHLTQVAIQQRAIQSDLCSQLSKERFGIFQVDCVEALRERAIDRRK
jgi:hypothetical protein